MGDLLCGLWMVTNVALADDVDFDVMTVSEDAVKT